MKFKYTLKPDLPVHPTVIASPASLLDSSCQLSVSSDQSALSTQMIKVIIRRLT